MPSHMIRREPAPSFSSIDRVLSSLFGSEPMLASISQIEEGTLALDVSEDEHNIIVRASLPGFRKEDVHVEVSDGVLTISATRNEEKVEKSERFYRKERTMGSVSRRIALPTAVEEAATQAKLNEGVLELKLPKTTKAMPRKITIG